MNAVTLEEISCSRVLTQFLGNIVRGESIQLVDGGLQMRSFTYIDVAINCLRCSESDTDAYVQEQHGLPWLIRGKV